MRRVVASMFLVILMNGCVALAPPIAPATSNNASIKVDKLFEVDGCTVYRFTDAYVPRYFAKCVNASPATTSWNERCGKGCVREQNVLGAETVPPTSN